MICTSHFPGKISVISIYQGLNLWSGSWSEPWSNLWFDLWSDHGLDHG
mgnify:CR=1 FL=1